MAEQALIADIRFGLDSLGQDASRATAISNQMSSDIAKALGKIDSSIKDLPSSFKNYNSELKQVESASKRAADSTGYFSGKLGTLKGGLAALGIGLGARELLKFGQEAYKSAVSLQSVERQLIKSTGSAEGAAKELAFVREETNRLGTSAIEGAQAFAQITNAAQGTVLEGQGVREVFSGINEVSSALNLGNEKTASILTQVNQGLSKQKFELSDLKIVGEAGIPVFKELEKALDIKEKGGVFKQISDGKIGVEQLILLVRQLRKDYGETAAEAAKEIPAQISRGINNIKLAFADVFTGVLQSEELKNLASSIGNISPSTSGLSLKEKSTNFANESIREFVQFGDLVGAIFTALGVQVQNVYDKITSYLYEKITEVSEKLSAGIKKLPGGETLLGFFDTLVTKIKGADKSTDDAVNNIKSKLENFPGILTLLLGDAAKGKTPEEQIDALIIKLRKSAGGSDNKITLGPDIAKTKEALTEEEKEYQAQADRILANQIKKNGELTADQKKELKNRLAAEEKYQDEVAKLNQQIYDRQIHDQEEVDKRVKEIEDKRREDDERLAEKGAEEKNKQIAADIEARLKKEEDAAQAEVDARTAVFEASAAQTKEIVDHLRDDLQSTLSDTLSGAFEGDLGNVQNIADTIVKIFTKTAGGISAALIIKPLFNNVLGGLVGQDFLAGTGDVGGLVGKALSGIKNIFGASNISNADFGKALGVAGAGIALAGPIGQATTQATGSKGAGIAAGAISGAISGAYAGSYFYPPYGTIIGGVVGGAAGAVQGGLFAKEPKPTELSVQTTPGIPTGGYEAGLLKRGPFGTISLYNEPSSATGEAANAALLAISEVDTAIAKYLDDAQRQIVEDFLQQPSLEDTHVEAQDAQEAIAKAVQLRYFHAIQALTDAQTAENVVGAPFEASSSDLQVIQQRATEALGILKLIEEFRIGPLSDTGAAIKKVNDEFQALVDKANTLGLPIDEIVAEQQRQLAEITTNFNTGVHDEILKISDPKQYDFEQLERAREKDVQNAIDSNGDVAQVEYLYNLKRQELEEKYAEKVDDTSASVEALIKSLDAFTNSTLSSTSQSLLNLQKQYDDLTQQAIAAGLSTDALTASYALQVAEIKQAARVQVFSALYDVTNPFYAALVQINQQIYEFQKLANEGLIDQAAINLYHQVAYEQALYNEALRRASGDLSAQAKYQQQYNDFVTQGLGISDYYKEIQDVQQKAAALADSLRFLGISTRGVTEAANRQIAEIKNEARQSALTAINDFIKPLDNAFAELSRQAYEFQELAAEGLIPQSWVNLYRQLAQGQAAVDRALQASQGGVSNGITQLADSFQQFVDAGSGRTAAQQQLYDLTLNFARLADSANILGLSTKALENSYLEQARVIKDDAIRAIDQELSARRQNIESIDQYLKALRIGPELPYNLRFDEAQKQFQDALRSGDLQEALRAGQAFEGIARERYGSTAEYFTARNQVESQLQALRDQEAAAVQAERDWRVKQEENQLQLIVNGRTSVDYLSQLNAHANDQTRGLEQLIAYAKQSQQYQADTYQLLRRTVSRIGG